MNGSDVGYDPAGRPEVGDFVRPVDHVALPEEVRNSGHASGRVTAIIDAEALRIRGEGCEAVTPRRGVEVVRLQPYMLAELVRTASGSAARTGDTSGHAA